MGIPAPQYTRCPICFMSYDKCVCKEVNCDRLNMQSGMGTKPIFKPDMVNHPPHYTNSTSEMYETIKVIEAWGLDKDFCLGNVVKYISRWDKKGDPVENLKKAQWYLNRKIENLGKNK